MQDFEVSPEHCRIVRAFAQTHSLRDAAKSLRCDPGSLARKAKSISDEHDLLHKIGGRWGLTEKGMRAVTWLDQSINTQKLAMSAKPRLRISTMAWFAEQVIVPGFDRLNAATDKRFVWSVNTANPRFEGDLLNGLTDYVIACHPPTDPMLAHKTVAPEAWVIVAPKAWGPRLSGKTPSEQIQFLKKQPFIRHTAIVPELAFGFTPEKPAAELLLDTLISVRAAVQSGYGWSCVPRILVRTALARREITEAAVEARGQGDLCLWWLRSRKDTALNVKPLLSWLRESV